MSLLYSALTYFAVVFGAGFVLGIFRVLALVPSIGERNAELVETPFMLVVVFYAAKWTVARLAKPVTVSRALRIGLIGFAIILFAELGVLFLVRHQTLHEYITSRDTLSGAVYVGALLIFAFMPAILVKGSDSSE